MDRCIYKMIKCNENGEVKEVKYFSSKPLVNEYVKRYEKQKDVYLVELAIGQVVERLNILVHNDSEVIQ